MKDYKLSELKKICDKAENCIVCSIKELCKDMKEYPLFMLEIDEEQEK